MFSSKKIVEANDGKSKVSTKANYKLYAQQTSPIK
jgi:hypothetical protein